MIIDSVDMSDLPASPELAFIEFEKRLRAVLEQERSRDRDINSDHNGNYNGSFLPDRYYVSSVLAFLDEYGLQIDVLDIAEVSDSEFQEHFSRFFNKINYAKTRFSLRKKRLDEGVAGTLIQIKPSFKDEITNLLGTIRKIVNQEVNDHRKKDAIFQKIRALQSEVDRDQTTVDSVFTLLLDFTETLGESAENLEPLIEKAERLKKLFFEGAQRQSTLPNSDRKQIEHQKGRSFELDDEIPF